MDMLNKRLAILGVLALAGCGPALKPPTLQVTGVQKERISLGGASLRVAFEIRNPNPDDVVVERFEYELSVNGHRLGRGYQADPIPLRGFDHQRVVSELDINLLSLPGAIKSVLNDDRAHAEVRGDFYLRQGGGLKKLGFQSSAEVDLDRRDRDDHH
jgi:LEA14-like dessication related protein